MSASPAFTPAPLLARIQGAHALSQGLLLAVLLVFAQLALAWHAPTHQDDDHGGGAVHTACDLCLIGAGLGALPSAPVPMLPPGPAAPPASVPAYRSPVAAPCAAFHSRAPPAPLS